MKIRNLLCVVCNKTVNEENSTYLPCKCAFCKGCLNKEMEALSSANSGTGCPVCSLEFNWAEMSRKVGSNVPQPVERVEPQGETRQAGNKADFQFICMMCNERVRNEEDEEPDISSRYAEIQMYNVKDSSAIEVHLVCKQCVCTYKEEVFDTDEGNGILKMNCGICQDVHIFSDADWEEVVNRLKDSCCTMF